MKDRIMYSRVTDFLANYFTKIINIRFIITSIIKTKYSTYKAEKSFIKKYGKRYKEITNYMNIAGWLTENEAITLFDLARQLRNKKPITVEIGSWLGKSTFVIAKGMMKRSYDPHLFCIDPFNAEGDTKSKERYHLVQNTLLSQKHQTLKEEFIQNMKKNKVYDIITVLSGYSFDYSKKFHKSIDFLFIDGNHEYKAVLRDYKDWSNKIRPGGIITFHDVEFNPYLHPLGSEMHIGPGLVVKEEIINNPMWIRPQRVDGLFFAVKK